jgi:spoIIIJ-associated protein
MENGTSGQKGDGPGALAPELLEEIQIYVEDIVDLAGLELDAEIYQERDALVLELVGPDSELLLDYGGETLDAFQVVLGKIIPRRFNVEQRILVDSNGSKITRERELIEVAHRAAEKVRKTGKPHEMSPMNSMERRIVHLALGGIQGVTTESTGEGDHRRVQILPVQAERASS